MEGQPGQSMTHSGQIYKHTNKIHFDKLNIDKTSRIEGEDQGYLLHVGGYRGDAGDSMAGSGSVYINNGMKFSTRDRDNDKWGSGSCAQWYNASWWCNS